MPTGVGVVLAGAVVVGRAITADHFVPATSIANFGRTSQRTAAASYTNTARYVVRPVGPLVAGATLQGALGAPFLIAGALKSTYDLALYALFRKRELP